MNLRKCVASLFAIAAIGITSAFANPNLSAFDPDKTIGSEIANMIQKIDFAAEDVVPGTSAKLKFLINENGELVVLTTGNEKVDSALKRELNYKKVNAVDLEAYKVYIVPISFKK